MYRLFYEEITGTYFVANEETVEIKLAMLTDKLWNEHAFSLNDFCDALGIPEEDPFGGYIFHSTDFDYPMIFDMYLEYCNNIPAMRIVINVA